MYVEPTLLATMTGIIGAMPAALWSYLMASKVAAPRAKRLIVSALTNEGPELQAVREHLINPALQAHYDAISAKLEPEGLDIASEVESAVNEALGAFRSELGPVVSEHVMMAVNQVKAQETKSLQAQLEQLGIGAVVGEAQDAVAAQLPPQLIQAQRLLSMKVSKKYASEHPLEAQALEAGKLWIMQMLDAQGMMNGGVPKPVAETETGGFGVR